MSAQKGKPRSPEGSRRIYENFFLSQTIHAEAQLGPTQEPAAFSRTPAQQETATMPMPAPCAWRGESMGQT